MQFVVERKDLDFPGRHYPYRSMEYFGLRRNYSKAFGQALPSSPRKLPWFEVSVIQAGPIICTPFDVPVWADHECQFEPIPLQKCTSDVEVRGYHGRSFPSSLFSDWFDRSMSNYCSNTRQVAAKHLHRTVTKKNNRIALEAMVGSLVMIITQACSNVMPE